MKKILFLASHRMGRSPNQRYRFEQYLKFLEKHGFKSELSHLISEDQDKMLYRRGDHFNKAKFVRNCYRIRRKDLARINDFDIVFVCREALMTRSTYFEKKFAASNAKMIFDFDDAIWLSNVSDANKRWKWMKNPKKTSFLIGISDLVVAGNEYLANYARGFNSNVHIIPSTINTDEYQVKQDGSKDERICIGWTGSTTTIQHFRYAVPFLKRIKEKFEDRVCFTVISDEIFKDPELEVRNIAWNKDSESQDLGQIDLGIMPLPYDEWTKGKCGMKGLQYMAMGIPTVMSPVGVNTDIIEHGVNGMLASGADEWVEQLSKLIEDADLRRRIGTEARRTVEEKYSVQANQSKYLQAFQEVLGLKQDKE